MSNHITDWSAAAVRRAIADSGRTKRSVSDESGIPYPTLNRKAAGKAEFSFAELLLLAEVLGVEPWQFTPPPFQRAPVPEVLGVEPWQFTPPPFQRASAAGVA